MDFEDHTHFYNAMPLRDANAKTVVLQVRTEFPNAMIGNYGDFPCAEDLSELYPDRIDRTHFWAVSNTDRNAFYFTSGLNVAMPNLYPYSYYIVHAGNQWNGFRGEDYISPNQRSAMFWAPLEKLSTAKRALPAGHELIPWVNDFIQWKSDGVPSYVPDSGQIPTLEDNKASLIHYRLRGADGYYVFMTAMDMDTYRSAIADAWHSLDPLFDHAGAQRVLNLDTNKIGGIEWSGVKKGNRVGVIVSNLNTLSQSVDWSAKPQLPAESPTVVAGSHVMLQYRSSALDTDDMEQYTAGDAMNNQGADSWNGPQSGQFTASAPFGSGNNSAQAVASTGGYDNKVAWFHTDNPGYTSADKIVYSAYMYRDVSTISFEPVNTDGASTAGKPDFTHQGPLVSLYGTALKVRSLYGSGTRYQAVNFAIATGHWYEVQLVIDPNEGVTGLGSVFVRDVTAGQKDFTRCVFDDPNTPSVTERLLQTPLALDTLRNTSNFDGWTVNTYGAGNAIDNLNTGYYVPRMNDNFEHYQTGVTNDNQTTAELRWHGSTTQGPSVWTITAPQGTGNTSTLAAQPTASAYAARAWWKTEQPDFALAEPVVYSAQLYGVQGVGFEAVSTAGAATTSQIPNNQTGFYGFIYGGTFRFRASRGFGDMYEATNFTAGSGKWYNVQIQVDPTRDIDGTAGGNFGVARIWIKNLTDGTAPVLLSFDNINTGMIESLTELPMLLTATNNPTVWDGWEVYGYDNNVQIDALRSFLYPYADYATHNQYIDASAVSR